MDPRPSLSLEEERDRRRELWQKLKLLGTDQLRPAQLRELGIYGGAAGIWVDLARTRAISGSVGVAVALLHTGRHYADDLSDTEVVYHYPETSRPIARDQHEVEATKEASRLEMPLFVVLPSERGGGYRRVRLGWVQSWDDELQQFLVKFGELPVAPLPSVEHMDSLPFELMASDAAPERLVKTRPGQPTFKFEVERRYGAACSVCDLDIPRLLDAAHLRGKSDSGSDDPRNGLVLCATHHRAFDADLFAIEPSTLQLRFLANGPSADELHIGRKDIKHLKRKPHPEAVAWRWGAWSQRRA
jgi:putative restriction endonuclease